MWKYRRRDNILSQAAAIRAAAAKQHPPVTKATTAEAAAAVEDEQKEQTTPATEVAVAVVSAPKSIVVALSATAIPLEVILLLMYSIYYILYLHCTIQYQAVHVLTTLLTVYYIQHAPDNDPRKKKLRNNQKRSKNKMRKKTGQGNNE